MKRRILCMLLAMLVVLSSAFVISSCENNSDNDDDTEESTTKKNKNNKTSENESSEVTEDSSEVTEDSSEVTEDSSEVTEDSSEVTEDSSEVTEDSSEVIEESSEVIEESSEVIEESSEPEIQYSPLVYFNQVVANENSATAWLYDIDGDGISELLIEGGTIGTYVEIYAFQNDEVVRLYENYTSREAEIYFTLANDGLYLCYDSGAYSSSGLVKYENGEIIVEKEESGNAGNGTPVNREMVKYCEAVDVVRVKINIQHILREYSDFFIYGNTCIYYINDGLVFVDNLSEIMDREAVGVFATGTGAFSLNDDLWCYDIEELVFLRSGDDFYVCKYQSVTDPFNGSQNVIPVEYYHVEKVYEEEEERGITWTYRRFVPVDSIPEDAVALTGGIYLEPLKDLRDYDWS